MKYEIEIYASNMSEKTENVVISGVGFMITDTCDGALFTIIGKRGTPMYSIPYGRLKSMRNISGEPVKKAAPVKLIDKKAQVK